MSNIFPKEESTKSLIVRHWKDEFFCTIWNIKWFKFSHGCILHSKSFPTSTHTPKSELKQRCYGPDKLEKKNQLLSRKLVATRRLCRNQETVSRPENLCRDQETVSWPENMCRDKKRCRNLKKAKKLVFDLISSPFHPRTIYILVF